MMPSIKPSIKEVLEYGPNWGEFPAGMFVDGIAWSPKDFTVEPVNWSIYEPIVSYAILCPPGMRTFRLHSHVRFGLN